jgi:ABC-2 type transport system permease protein
MKHSALIFLQFLRRDFYVHGRRIGNLIVNYSIIYPVMYAFVFGYIQTNVYFGHGNATQGTILLAGNISIIAMIITFQYALDLLLDLEHDRFIDYQMTILHPSLIIIERILFSSLFAFLLVIPSLPLSKILLQENMDTHNTAWGFVFIAMYLGALCCAAYHQLAIILIKKSDSISLLWSRVNIPFIALGGFWIPFHIIYTYSPLLGNAVRINPILYFSEGLRQALVGGPQFFSFTLCISMLICFSIIFCIASLFFFKRRVDHI